MFNKINVCFCVDINLFKNIEIVINSMIRKNEQHNLIIHIIYEYDEKLDTLIDELKTKFHEIEFYTYKQCWKYKYISKLWHISKATMIRLYIPKLIVKDIILIYLDVDLIVNVDLNKMLEEHLCSEFEIIMKNSYEKNNLFRSEKKKSGNCGVMIMNLKILRSNNFTEKCIAIHNKYKYKVHDQEIINYYCNGKHGQLKQNYNIFLFQDENLVESNDDFIFHFCGSKKPWNQNIPKYQYLWDRNKSSFISAKKTNLGLLSFTSSLKDNISINIGDYIQSLSILKIYKVYIETKLKKKNSFRDFLSNFLNDNLY